MLAIAQVADAGFTYRVPVPGLSVLTTTLTLPDANLPDAVRGDAYIYDFTALLAGGWTCAVTVAGGAKCWGNGASGVLGNGTNTSSSVPVNVLGLGSPVTTISVGRSAMNAFTCAVTTGGAAKCWGNNSNGLVGDGTTTNRLVPTDVAM